jgi:hypothetical protein
VVAVSRLEVNIIVSPEYIRQALDAMFSSPLPRVNALDEIPYFNIFPVVGVSVVFAIPTLNVKVLIPTTSLTTKSLL